MEPVSPFSNITHHEGTNFFFRGTNFHREGFKTHREGTKILFQGISSEESP